ncbi:unnamed protein product [Camellia sinensis]
MDLDKNEACEIALAEIKEVLQVAVCAWLWLMVASLSSFTRDDVYVLEFFMPVSNKACENLHTSFGKILETMSNSFQIFRIASGEMEEDLCIEEIDFQN